MYLWSAVLPQFKVEVALEKSEEIVNQAFFSDLHKVLSKPVFCVVFENFLGRDRLLSGNFKISQRVGASFIQKA